MPEKDRMNAPTRYCVFAEAEDPNTLSKFLYWLEEEHIADLLKVNGCIECRIYQSTKTTLHCEYLFSSAAHLKAYIADEAPRLREKSLQKFKGAAISFRREESTLLFERKSD